jgi:hypothetical protein
MSDVAAVRRVPALGAVVVGRVGAGQREGEVVDDAAASLLHVEGGEVFGPGAAAELGVGAGTDEGEAAGERQSDGETLGHRRLLLLMRAEGTGGKRVLGRD